MKDQTSNEAAGLASVSLLVSLCLRLKGLVSALLIKSRCQILNHISIYDETYIDLRSHLQYYAKSSVRL